MEEPRHSLSRIGEGLTSCLDIPELQHLTSLRSLCLHGNNIGGIEGLEQLSALQDLNLSSNCISSVTNLGSLTSLTSLNLASNKLVHLQGLEPLPNLVQLNLSYNALTSLAGLAVLAGPSSKLRVLDVRQNAVPSLQAFAVLAGCVSLRDLSIAGNPACAAPNHRHTLLQALPQVAKLDGVSSADVLVSPPDVASVQLYAAERLQTFDQQVAGRRQHLLSPQRQPQQAQAQQQGGIGRTPRIDASLAVYQPGKQLVRDSTGKGPSPAHFPWHQPDGAGSLLTEQRWERQQQQTQSHLQGSARQSLNWQQQSQQQQQHGGMTGSSQRQQQHTESSWPAGSVGVAGTRGSTGHTEGSDTRQRIYVVDAATQTAEHMSIQARLQAEADLLRQQLMQLTDELERRNVLEEEVQQDMQAAILAAQEQAHKQVEEGYKEASQAVATALRELEAARLQGQVAQDQVVQHMKAQEEAKAQCTALHKDVARLQDDVRNVRDQASAEQQRLSAAWDQERQRVAEAQQSLQRQLSASQDRVAALSTDLATMEQRAATAEQRTAALESALQQANSATASMTGQMAQSMADASKQVEQLKGKLAVAEQQLAEQQRRDAEARAEISMLVNALSVQKQSHQQELEARDKAAAEQLAAAVGRERGAAEERGKASVLMQAEKEKGALQEQLTFLKMQLQYALTESERESAQLSENVRQGQAEVEELRGALQAAAAKSKEQETLVADLTHVLQQQKAHIQALQKEKEALVQQLRAYAPERLDRLIAENQALRRANAELDVLREQLAHHKRAWQDAERRHLDSQTAQSRAVEEAQAKAAGLEAAVAAAKGEATGAMQKAEALQQQLTAAEDAVKVKRAMLDSANDTIEQLKAELADMQNELDETRRMAEELEGQLRSGQEQDATEKVNLRSEIEAGEAALERMSASMSEAQAKQREAEAKLKATQDALAEKDSMISYINEEVDRVKGLFEQREGRLREERDAARHQAERALTERDAAESKVKDMRQQVGGLGKELEAAQAETRACKDAVGTAEAEAAAATRRVAEVEEEMRLLLVALDRQKAVSASKMKQLASILQDL